jgi:hypothetical protein
MTQEEKSQQNSEIAQEEVFTPEPFSPQWDSDPIDLLEIPLNFPYSSKEWDVIFETFIDLLAHQEHWLWDRAIDRLLRALEIEESQRSSCGDYRPSPTDKRLKSIFEAIATQTQNNPDIFEMFCSKFSFLAKDATYNQLVIEWLNQLAASEDLQAPTQEAILAAQIFLGAYDSTWQEVGANLIELLDHTDLNLRACAAHQIGKFCSKAFYSKEDVWEWTDDNEQYERDKQSVVGMPSLETMMQLIRDKEIERPGVAGAFWGVIPKDGFDAKEWLLDLLENSPEPEPYIPYFPCDLAFDAHERFSRDADAVSRLIDMGRTTLALAAATDESCRVVGLEPLLIELGFNEEPEIIRVASWHLAYYYHYLHPRGAELGYVELISELSEVDLFLLFSREKDIEPPYAVVIYPKRTDQKLSRAIAQRWVDQIFPGEIRGEPRGDLPRSISHWYERGYIAYHRSAQNTNSDLIDHVIIGYRSELLWTPKQFL